VCEATKPDAPVTRTGAVVMGADIVGLHYTPGRHPQDGRERVAQGSGNTEHGQGRFRATTWEAKPQKEAQVSMNMQLALPEAPIPL
jgi:hypothetical protein